LTTLLNYGEVACQRQGEIIRGLTTSQQAANVNEIVEAVEVMVKKLRNSRVDM